MKMKTKNLLHSDLCRLLIAIGLTLAFVMLTPGTATAQDPIDPRLDDCILATENCTANDFGGITSTAVTLLSDRCYYDADLGYDVVDVTTVLKLSAANADRYDIGYIFPTDGGTIFRPDPSSGCYRDILTPILFYENDKVATEWPNLDSYYLNAEPSVLTDVCGDLYAKDYALVTLTDITVRCQDTDKNGQLDMEVCVFYDNNAQTTCLDVITATTGTTAKCQCFMVNLNLTPTAIEGLTFSASSRALPVGLALSGLGLVVIGGVLLSVYLRRRAGT